MNLNRRRHANSEAGGALVSSLVVIILMSGLTAAMMQIGLAEYRGWPYGSAAQ